MPFAQNKANFAADVFDIYVDGAKAPYQARATWDLGMILKPIVTARTGTTPVAHILNGVDVTIEITWQQMTIAELETLLSTGAAAPRNLVHQTATPTAFEIELRPAGATDQAQSIILFECVLESARYENDGEGERELITRFKGQLDQSTDLLGRIGPLV